MFVINAKQVITTITLSLFSIGAFAHETIVGGDDVTAADQIASTTVALYFESAPAIGQAARVRDGSTYDRIRRSRLGEGSICTGSILDSGTILTAAHCVIGAKQGVVIFSTDIKNHNPANTRQISAVKVYARLSNTAATASEQRDIATVTFLGGLPAGYKPVQTISSQAALTNSLQAGGSIVLAGYGVTSYNPANPIGSSATAGTLRKVTTKIEKVGTSNLWVGFVGKTACHGDSGGPAFINYQGEMVLVGVTSRSTRPTGDCNGDSIYTQFTGLNSFKSSL